MAPHRLSMIEPGPVHTEFETKMLEDVAKMEYPGADPDTVRYFKDVYLPSSIDIFEAMGQTPDDIAKVRNSCLKVLRMDVSVTLTNWYNYSFSPHSCDINANFNLLLVPAVP